MRVCHGENGGRSLAGRAVNALLLRHAGLDCGKNQSRSSSNREKKFIGL